MIKPTVLLNLLAALSMCIFHKRFLSIKMPKEQLASCVLCDGVFVKRFEAF